MSFLSGLQIAFIVLKLTGFISWSWLWVLSPAILFAIFLIASIYLAYRKG